MTIKGKQIDISNRCPHCKTSRRLGFEGKKGNRPAIVCVYAKIADGSKLTSKDNVIGWICRNCGEHKIEVLK